MISKDRVALPSTIESRRTHPTSYMKDASPVPNATVSMTSARPLGRAPSSADRSIGGSGRRSRIATSMIPKLMAAATASAPCRPT
jgi:hypothetical protein